MKQFKQIAYLCAIALITISSCKKKDEDTVDPEVTEQSSSGITMSLKTTGGDETEFVVNAEDIMSGEISALGTGIEQKGWRFFYPVGKTLFSSGYSDDNQCIGYADNGSGVIEQKGSFVFDNALEMFGASDDETTLLAMEIPRAGFTNRSLHFVDVSTFSVSKIVETKIFEDKIDSIIAWPTSLQVRGDKLFVPFHKLDAKGWFTTPEPNEAFIAIYSYPNVGTEPEKIISDSRTSNIGTNGYTTGLIEADNGDLYSYSCGASLAGFSPVSTKPSGILKINNGETEFDASYFFDIEAATGGGKLFWFDYVGDNKAIGRVLTDDIGDAWSAYGATYNQKIVIIDLVAQTVTDVANIPLSSKQFTSPVLVENDLVYESIETATDSYVYAIDIATATATKGAKIIGNSVKGFYRL